MVTSNAQRREALNPLLNVIKSPAITFFLNSISETIAEQIRAYKNVYGTVTDDRFLKRTDVSNFLLRLSKVKHQ